MNIDALEAAFFDAERRVLEIQAKLHRWAVGDPHRRFDDLYNLIADPAFLLVAWFPGAEQQGRQGCRRGRHDRPGGAVVAAGFGSAGTITCRVEGA